jgi:hypothetical protein
MTWGRRDRETLRDLQAVDWDFPEKLPGAGASIHWYPASFHASLPATLVEALSAPGEMVFDPYAGTGATGLQAIRQNRRTWLVDANPVAVLASYAAIGLALLERKRRGLGIAGLGNARFTGTCRCAWLSRRSWQPRFGRDRRPYCDPSSHVGPRDGVSSAGGCTPTRSTACRLSGIA